MSLRTKVSKERKRLLLLAFAELPLEERAGYIRSVKKYSEFEVQAHLYDGLRKIGYHVRGELTSKCMTCRFDIVVFDGHKAIRVVEVKARKPAGSGKNKKIAAKIRKCQIERYSVFGVQVDKVCGFEESVAYLEKVKASGFQNSLQAPVVS